MANKSLVLWLLIICGVITIYLLTSSWIDGYRIWGSNPIKYDVTGQIGDFIGGVVGTIISGAGFYFLYLTLRAQRIAFEEQGKAFERERLESKFFDLVKMHRDNVAELKYNGVEFIESDTSHKFRSRQYEGKRVFTAILGQFIHCWNELKPFFKREERIFERQYKSELEVNPKIIENKIDHVLLAKIDICYSIIFYGVSSEGLIILREKFKGKYKEKFTEDILRYLSLKPADDTAILSKWIAIFKKHRRLSKISLVNDVFAWREGKRQSASLESIFDSNSTEQIVQNYHNRYTKFYGGHQFRLGHYFRHLFQVVKYINSQKNISYDTKYEYIKILRAQLSTYEQAILFINSLSSMGYVWEMMPEINSEFKDFKKQDFEFITKYNLIKNLPSQTLYGIPIKMFYPDVEFEGSSFKRDKRGYK
jgi:hypothetical protein